MAKPTVDIRPGWLNKRSMCASLGISPTAFDKWGVEPVIRHGREAFYDARTVLENRLSHAQAKYQPADADGIDPLAEKKLTQERLRLTTAQADAQEKKNAVTDRDLVPAEFATFALENLSASLGSLLDTVPLKVRRRHPDLEVRHIETIEREIVAARNLAAALADKLPRLLDEFLSSLDDKAS